MTRVRVQTFEETGATGEVWIRDTASATGGAYGAAGGGGPATSLDTTGAAVDVGSSAPPTVGQVLTATSATTATWQTPSGGGATLTAATITVPFELQEQTVSVVDALATVASKVMVVWGNTADTDENQPSSSNVTFSAVGAAGSISVTVSDNGAEMVGGVYNILYILG